MAHVETIADRDIQALYRRELLRLFSAFAFPPRDWSGQQNVIDISQARRWAATQHGSRPLSQSTQFPGRFSKEWSAKLAKPTERDKHLHRRLGAAITAGLLYYPEFAMLYAETLLQVKDLDPRLHLIVDQTYESDILDREQLVAILSKNGHSLPVAAEWDDLRFPFTWPPPDDLSAVTGLEKALKLYAGLPQVDLALRRATEMLGQDFSDHNWNEQQRLLKRSMEFKLELRQMAAA